VGALLLELQQRLTVYSQGSCLQYSPVPEEVGARQMGDGSFCCRWEEGCHRTTCLELSAVGQLEFSSFRINKFQVFKIQILPFVFPAQEIMFRIGYVRKPTKASILTFLHVLSGIEGSQVYHDMPNKLDGPLG